MYAEEDYLMLSGIQHYAFCQRQWALIHIEQQWEENYKTTLGELFHKRAHDESLVEKRGDILITRGVRVASQTLGITGQCDVVEFHKYEDGIQLQGYQGTWKVVPVEYKRGKKKDGMEDIVQLCAQAICLEEMLLTSIDTGYLYYGETKRRLCVEFDHSLRSEVHKICMNMHQLYAKGHTPKVKRKSKCESCSLKEICLPELLKRESVSKYISRNIKGDGQD